MPESTTNLFPVSVAIGLGTTTVLVLVYAMLGGKQTEAKKVVGEEKSDLGIREKKKVKEAPKKVSSKIKPRNAVVTPKKTSAVEKASGTNIVSDKKDRKANAGENEESDGVKKSSKRRKKRKPSLDSTNVPSAAASVPTVAKAAKPAKPSTEPLDSDSEEFIVVPVNMVTKKSNSTTAAKSAIPSTVSSSSFGPGRFDLLSENTDVTAVKSAGKAGESRKRKGIRKAAAPTVTSEVAETNNDVDSDSFVTVTGKTRKKKIQSSTPSVSGSNNSIPPVLVDESATPLLETPMTEKVEDVAIPAVKANPEAVRSGDSEADVVEKSGKKKKSKKKSTIAGSEREQKSHMPSIQSAGNSAVSEVDANGKEEAFETATKKKKKSKKNVEGSVGAGNTKGHNDKASAIVQQVGENDADIREDEVTKQTDKPRVEEFDETPALQSRPTVPVESGAKGKKKAGSSSSSSNVSHVPGLSANSNLGKATSSGPSSTLSSAPTPAAVKVNARPQASRASQMAFLVDAFPTISVDVISAVLTERNGSIEETMVALISRDSFVSSASLYTPPSGTSSTKKSQRSVSEEASRRPEQRWNVRDEETDEEEEEEEEETVDADGWKVEKKKGKKGSGSRNEKGKEVSSSEADEEEKISAPISRLPPKPGKSGSNVTVTGGSSNSFLSLLELDNDEEEDSDEEESEEEKKWKGKSGGGKGGKNGKKRS